MIERPSGAYLWEPRTVTRVLVQARGMTFIEQPDGTPGADVIMKIAEAYSATYFVAAPDLGLGQQVVWNGRRFQEVLCQGEGHALAIMEDIFRCWALPFARMQVGSQRGSVFFSPPAHGDELCARIKEKGRCGKEYWVAPIQITGLEL